MKKLALQLILGGAAVATPAIANAAVVDFEDKAAFSCNLSGSDSSGGMSYSYGFAVCYYSPADPADFPTAPPSTVMASGFASTTFSLTGGAPFDLASLDLAFGPFGHSGLTTDTTQVVGNLFGGGTVSTVLTVGYPFQNYSLNWTNLASVTFGQLQRGSEYLAFDNIVYNSGTAAVPEPSTWLTMILGFAAIGFAMRSRRQQAKVNFAF